MTMNDMPSMRKQSGVGLIEILIAVLVLSIGFLGMAALQAKALSNNNSAMARTQAVIASYSIMDAMRADRENAIQGVYDGTVNVYDTAHDTDASVDPNNCDSVTASQPLAEAQLQAWCGQMAATLGVEPNTRGEIACGSDEKGICIVTIVFDDQRGSGGQAEQTLTLKGIL